MNERNALRREARLRRARAAADGTEVAAILLKNFLAAVPHGEHQVIAGYWPVGTEVDDLPILRELRAMNKEIGLPGIVADDAPLVFRAWDDRESLVPGRYSIPTPPEGAAVLQPTLVVVPLLLFDGTGHRIGSGKGFYDRTLASLRDRSSIVAVGVAYAAQRTTKLETLATDQRMDCVVTEEGVEWF
jgi:5-formyltetrahydrofolate cyclo-ligase